MEGMCDWKNKKVHSMGMEKASAVLMVLGLTVVFALPMMSFEAAALAKPTTIKIDQIRIQNSDNQDNYDSNQYNGGDEFTYKYPDFCFVVKLCNDDNSVIASSGYSSVKYEVTSSLDRYPDAIATWNSPFKFNKTLQFGQIYKIIISVYDWDPASDRYESVDTCPTTGDRAVYIRYDMVNDTYSVLGTNSVWSSYQKGEGSSKGEGSQGSYYAKVFFKISDDRTDTTPPTCDVTQNPPNPIFKGWSGWFTQAVVVTIDNMQDDNWDGANCYVKYCTEEPSKMTVWKGPIYKSWSGSTTTLLPAGQGTLRLVCQVYDPSDNMKKVYDGTLKVDTIKPTISNLTGPAGIINTPQVTFTWTGKDSTSGINKYYYAIDSANPTISTTNSTITLNTPTTDGEHKFYIKPVDVAGWVGNVYSVTFTVKMSASNPTGLAGPTGWVTADTVQFTWEGVDVPIGVAHYHYKVDDGTVTQVANSTKSVVLDTPSDGTHTFSLQVEDVLGQTGAWMSVDFKVDREKPTITDLAGPSGWMTGTTASFTWKGNDAYSGIRTYNCLLDNEPLDPTSAAKLDLSDVAEGMHTVTIVPEDIAGNVGDPATATFSVDRTAPVVTGLTGPDGWVTTSNVTFRWSGNDNSTVDIYSGIDHYVYVIDSGSEQRGSSPLVLNTPADGEHTLSVKAVDVAGNTGEAVSVTFKVDQTNPTVSKLTAPTDWILAEKITVTWEGVDAGSGIARYLYSTDYLDEKEGASPLTLDAPADGTHWISVRAVDVAGNTGEEATAQFKVDRTAPGISGALLSGGVQTTKVREVTITVSLTGISNGSALKTLSYQVGTGSWVDLAAPSDMSSGMINISLTLPNKKGDVIIKFKAADTAGNAGTESSATFTYAPASKPAPPAGFPLALVAGIIAIVAVVAVVLALLMRRKKGPATTAPPPAPPIPQSLGAVAPAPQQQTQAPYSPAPNLPLLPPPEEVMAPRRR